MEDELVWRKVERLNRARERGLGQVERIGMESERKKRNEERKTNAK